MPTPEHFPSAAPSTAVGAQLSAPGPFENGKPTEAAPFRPSRVGLLGSNADFLRRKGQILASLDKSPKGSLDAPILGFLAWLNAQTSVVTTSSCSGRTAIFLGSDDPASSKGGQWLLSSHEPVSSADDAWNEVMAGLQRHREKCADEPRQGSMVSFLFEPFLLHAECADAETAQRILEIAREVGMRESGLSLGRKRVMVQLRTLALRLEVPLALDGEMLVERQYFDTLVRLANARLAENARRVERLWNRLREAFSSTVATTEEQLPWVLVCPKAEARGAKLALEERDWLDAARKMQPMSTSAGEAIGLPITDDAVAFFEGLDEGDNLAERGSASAESPDVAIESPAVDEAGGDLQAADDAKMKKAARKAAATKPSDLAALWRKYSIGNGGNGDACMRFLRSDALPWKQRPTQHGTPGSEAADAALREQEAITQIVLQAHDRAVANGSRSAGEGNKDLAELLGDVRNCGSLQWREDVALLPRGSLSGRCWEQLQRDAQSCGGLWEPMRSALGARLLCRQQEIDVADGRRSGAVDVLAGAGSGWVVVPGPRNVRYTYDVTRCMFSEGNAAEKARVAEWAVQGETILDMYTGIGFWTLPLLAAGAERVYSCEWNPDAVDAFRRGLDLLGPEYRDRCEVLAGDNRRQEVRDAAANRCHRVMLGLIPFSRAGFPNAVAALREEGGMLHVHWNVAADEEHATAASVAQELETNFRTQRGQPWICRVASVQRIKWFAPRVRHVRIDVSCKPQARADTAGA